MASHGIIGTISRMLLPAEANGGARVMAAMTSQKRTLDFNREFDRFKQALLRLNQGEPTGKP